MISGCHEGSEGHASVLKTYQKVRDRFYWPGMFLDVQDFVKYCGVCNRNTDKSTRAPIKDHIMAEAPRETVVIDLLHFPKAKGDKYLLVAVNAYSRWGELKALPDKYAATVADAIVKATPSGHVALYPASFLFIEKSSSSEVQTPGTASQSRR